MMEKKNVQIRMFFLIGLVFLSTIAFSQDPNFYIYVCFGQSNMEGQGTIEQVDKTVDERFRVMEAVDCSNYGRTKGSWYTAVPPLTRCYSGLSPSDYFGRTMLLNLPDSIKVGIINVSVAGCKIELFDKENYQDYVSSVTESWLKNIIDTYDGNPYGYLVDIAKLAQKDGVIKGILLHQGESNTGDNQWPAKVKGVYDNLIKDLALIPDSVPLLAGEVVHLDQGGVCGSMNSIIAKLPLAIPNAYVIPSKGCTDQADNLHFNSAGYRELGRRYAKTMLYAMDYDSTKLVYPGIFGITQPETSLFYEAECATVGGSWEFLADTLTSNGYCVTVKPNLESKTEAPTDSSGAIYFPFSIEKEGTYNVFARLYCPALNKDSYWIKMDDGEFEKRDRLLLREWGWLKINSFDLNVGEHTLTFAYREKATKLDKIWITDAVIPPSGMGWEAASCVPAISTGMKIPKKTNAGYSLGQNYPNPFYDQTTISFEIPEETKVSLKVFNMLGVEIEELTNKEFMPGKHSLEFTKKISAGNYIYTLKTDKYSITRKMSVFSQK